LADITGLIGEIPKIKDVISSVREKQSCTLVGVPSELKIQLLHYLYMNTEREIVYVLQDDYTAHRTFDSYDYPEKRYLPEQYIEFRYVESQSSESKHERIRCFGKMAASRGVTFLSLNNLLMRMRDRDRIVGSFREISVGDVIDPSSFRDLLIKLGYQYSSFIETVGQYSGRGEILEFFSPDKDDPVRITFFDDEVESIRYFDQDSQKSYGDNLDKVSILPSDEYILEEDEQHMLLRYLDSKKKEMPELCGRYIEQMTETGTLLNIEAFLSVIGANSSVLDFCNDPLLVFEDENHLASESRIRKETREKMLSQMIQDEQATGAGLEAYFDADVFLYDQKDRSINYRGLSDHPALKTGTVIDLEGKNMVSFNSNIHLFIDSVRNRLDAGYRVYAFLNRRESSVRDLLQEEGLSYSINAILDSPGISIVKGDLETGFEISPEKLLYICERDIFRERKERKSSFRRQGNTIELADLGIGDIVVHEVHGKGRYLGIKTEEVDGTVADFLELEYRDGDKLFLPVSQISRIDKYIGPDDENVILSKLGGREWESAKNRARKSVKKLAEDLVSIYRERANREGFKFSKDTVWQTEFENNFEFEETPGQLESIEQIKEDMESPRIMDRLLLGDVGFGKTEVAMRAAFKAVMDSKQVAVLVPTTLLARQHYTTFRERFSGFPVNIEIITRYTKKPKTAIERINSGKTDIIIGTHKLLSKEVTYHNLGLLIIDEEHRFGVSHKEKIKDMKRTVDVLTLTATPIPRTLEMALTGIRDISTIDSAPEIRKSVQSFVVQFDWTLVRDAILNEMNRGGQVYFVCRKIMQMDPLLKELHERIPEAKVICAHGRMSEEESERNMSAFIEHEYDVLLCTTIVESGIDIPSVNTMIIYEADKFGLAQLYQLRGRIGRSSYQAYAYFTHFAEDVASDSARKRLEAIKEFTNLGSGMKIAMRDLQIRGAGNILGAEQSGHMASIGYSLYVKMVKEAVMSSLGQAEHQKVESTVNLGLNAYIPNDYIVDENLKIYTYKQIYNLDSVKRGREIRDELQEKFGSVPVEVQNLIITSIIRSFAEKAGLSSVVRQGDVLILRFSKDVTVDSVMLIDLLSETKGKAEIRNGKETYLRYGHKTGRRYDDFLQFLKSLSDCISISNQV